MTKYFFIFLSAALLIIFAQGADAAVLSAFPETRTITQGQEVVVDIKINSENVSINAVQATVHFPSNILELTEESRSNSVFNFWLEEPIISNEDGTLKFIGGTTKGISGGSLEVLQIKFRAVSLGTAEISINDAVVTASDGRGTNVLSSIEGTSIVAVPEVVAPAVLETAPAPVQEQQVAIEIPEAVIRPPVVAAGLPSQPKLRVPLYPDESRWYNHTGEVIIFWEVPEDVIKVATAIDQNPSTSPEDIEPQLLTGKSFGKIAEGIWYLHVQFRNNIGWGPEAHYKISLDATPPVSFEAGIDNEVSDNPSPTIFYETYDSLSGVSHALIYVDNQEPIESKETSFALPLQPPGKKLLKVRFFDLAGNSVEDDLEFEILALPSPIIEFVTKSVTRDEPVFISGSAIADAFVDLKFYNKAGEILKKSAKADSSGKWSLSVEDPFLIDNYKVTATTRDERGALSYPSESEEFRVRPSIILSAGPFDFGYFEVILIMVLAIASGLGFYGWYYLGIKRKREAYAVIVARDVEKMHRMLEENLNKLENNIRNLHKFINPITKDIDPTMKEESLVFVKMMRQVLDKIKKYVKQEVEELK